MTKKIGNTILIYPEEPQQCDECGKIEELRPYGKDGARICYDCGMKNPRETTKNMWLILFGEEPTENEYKNMGYGN